MGRGGGSAIWALLIGLKIVATGAVAGCSSKSSMRTDGGPLPDSSAADAPVDAVESEGSRSAAGGDSGGLGSDAGSSGEAASPDSATSPMGCPSGLVCDGHCVATGDVHHCGSCTTDCADLPNVAATGLACVTGHCMYSCSPGFTACDDAGTGCPVDLSGSSRFGTPYCGSCTVTCNRTGAMPDCAATSDAGANFACVGTCPAYAPTTCTDDCVDLTTNVNNCGSCYYNCGTNVAHAHPTCAAGACGFGCNPGYAACGGSCVDLATDPANCGACGAACGTNQLCRGRSCVCLLTCGGPCVDSDTDPANCGACGHDCLGGTCAAGMCQPITLASGQNMPWCLAVDSQSVNWTNYNGPTVMRAALDGGNPVTLATGTEPYGIAVDSQNVYWTDGNDGIVWRSPVDGGAKVQLASGSVNELRAVVIDSGRVYWGDDARGIFSVSTDGGAPVTVASTRYSNTECQLAFDGARVYWPAYPGQDTVQASPLSGGPIATLGMVPSNLGDTSAIAVDSNNAYFNMSIAGKVLSVPLSGGAVMTLSSSAGSPQAIVVDRGRAFWADAQGTIRSVPVDGGAEILHASGQGGPWDLVLDDNAIYWVNRGDGTVMKVAR
jgi:hypothetical protein